jgi:DNA sulfur modification protein DndD
MILHEIRFHHFLAYFGDQAVALPSGGESALTVIVGPNNSGKTSFLRGLKFWLYGEKAFPNEPELLLLANLRAKSETAVGKSLSVWVEVTFERQSSAGNERVTLRRTLECNRRGPEQWVKSGVRLEPFSKGYRVDSTEKERSDWQTRLEGMMPRALFDAFYFKGEPLDGKVLGEVAGIREALGMFLHEDQWKEAEKAATIVRDRIDAEIAKLSVKSQELTKKLAERANVQAQLDSQSRALQEELETQAALETEQDELTDALSKLGDEKAAAQAKAALDAASREAAEATKALETADAEIVREIGGSRGIPFLNAAIEPVSTILAELEKDNILPADISPGFIDRVVTRETCICGTTHSDSTRSAWEAYREKTLRADVSEGLRKLLDWVKPDGSMSIQVRATRTSSRLSQLLEARRTAVEQRELAKRRLDQTRKDLALVPHEEIARIGRELKRVSAAAKETDRRLVLFQAEVTKREVSLKRIDGEISELQRKAGVNPESAKKLQSARERADGLAKLLVLCRNRLVVYFHRVLQTSVSSAYDSKATDGSRATIDRKTLLPSIYVGGAKTGNLGGGQSQLLALAYVVALARLRQTMHSQMETLGVRLGKIDDLSFFMDSPLGNMEEHYKQAAVELIPGSARQVVVLLWKEDWVFARPILEPQAAAIHAVKFHTTAENLAKIAPAERIYPLPGGDMALVAELSADEKHSRSELLTIRP